MPDTMYICMGKICKFACHIYEHMYYNSTKRGKYQPAFYYWEYLGGETIPKKRKETKRPEIN